MNSNGSPDAAARTVILVVDDEPFVLRVIGSILRARGYTVLSASNAMEALEVFRRSPAPRLLLTDVVMPGISGPELAANLLALDPGLRVLFTAGMPDSPLIRENILEKGHPFLPKPFLPSQLLDKIGEVLAPRACAAQA